ncbi:hypothetical protein Tco_0906223 [Tanacetum coccineum]
MYRILNDSFRGTNSYEFLIANKKCLVDVEVFRKILNIYPRVQRVDFAEVPDDETTLTFLIDLGYKGPLYKHPYILRKSRIDILWGMFYRENVDYPELIWEDFAFQIDCRQRKKGKLENIPYPRGKGSQEKKTVDTSEVDVDVSKESDSELARKRTASRRVIKKKVSISADDNIIPGPDVALELGKSISLTEAIEEEASRQVHATHAKIVTEFIPDPARRRPSGITFRDTSSMTKKLSPYPSQKLKGILTLTPKEKLADDTMKALKVRGPVGDSQVLKAQVKELVAYQGFPISPQSSLLPQVKEMSEYSEEDDDDVDDDDKIIDLEKTDNKETDDDFVHSDAETENGDEEITDVAKADAEKTEEVKDDTKKAKLPPTSSSLSISLGFGYQFLNLSSDTSLIGTAKDTTDAEINSLLDV